jgi:hypothetical protein
VKNRVVIGVARIGAAVLLGGCFSYRTVELVTVPEGEDVRLELTRRAVSTLPEIPKQSGSTLTGTLVRKDDEQIRVRVPIAVRQDGLLTRSLEQEVRIAAGDIVHIERREFNRVRTGVAVLSGAAAVAVLVGSFLASRPPDPAVPSEEEEGSGIRLLRFLAFSFSIRGATSR